MKLWMHDERGTTGGVRLVVCLLIVTFIVLAGVRSRAQVTTDGCAGDHAAFLYTIAQFVHWPSGHPQQPLVIGILGDDALVAVLGQTVHGRTIDGRPVVVRRLSAATQIRDCQLAYIGTADPALLRTVLTAAADAGVLTISAMPGFEAMGGIVHLISGGSQWRFVINYRAAERSGLWISSEVLNLAVAEVSGEP